MKNTHIRVSKCCGVKIRHFGQRRRQCVQCRKTWRIRIKKRGRPTGKIRMTLLERIFCQQRSLLNVSQRYRLTPQGLTFRFRKILRKFVQKQSPLRIPSGRLILLIDGLWFSFSDEPWILYLGALKPVKGHHAIFWDPLLVRGPESLTGWKQFLGTIPPKVKKRICALVCDNFRGLKGLAHQNHWILQLCHFHLIRQFQSRRGHWKPGIGRQGIRESIYQLVRQALELPDGARSHRVLSRLRMIQRHAPTARLPLLIHELLRSIEYYRSFQIYPELNLPTTTNTIESMNRLIRDLMRRVGNLRTPQSLQLWAIAFIRIKHKIVCNGKHFQPN